VVTDHPYAELLRQPNQMHDPFMFWLWTRSTLDIYGEAFWGKVRDAGGRPVELVPLHPTSVTTNADSDGKVTWAWDNGVSRIDDIKRRDLVHFKLYNPDSLVRGMSPLEPLRSTLENEAGARAANSAMWRNGARPSSLLKHPKNISEPAQQRLRAQWSDLHSGADNWAKTVILEEGMEAQILPLNVEELQYIEARKLNREEACAIYDVPPPVVHILDRATFSNITEQMRSMYRDTMAPKLRFIESTLEMELRDGRMGDRNREPDFGEGVYAEFLMDEVLRGDFEVRVPAIAQAIQTGQLTPNEGRRIENRPPVDGGDTLFINSAVTPIVAGADAMTVAELSLALQKIYLSVGKVITPEEAREILNREGANLVGPAPVLDPLSLRSVMGKLSRVADVKDIDPAALIAGLNGEAPVVLAELAAAQTAGESIPQFRERIKALGGAA
jgi:HK97 family phage portal protein